ncbi:MAG: riboflavin kinase [Treponema sp.]|jgi:riboflavin kinase/FMN adenylyltransferase|nr:riboflavin kinase [Treponema sp.]
MEQFVFTGEVIHGNARGRTVGMPTANLKAPEGAPKPEPGVYASSVTIKGKAYLGVTNIGPRPTVDIVPVFTIEIHILDFDEDIYGEIITLRIHRFLRPIRKFGSLEEVKNQVQKDIVQTRRFLEGIFTHPAG